MLEKRTASRPLGSAVSLNNRVRWLCPWVLLLGVPHANSRTSGVQGFRNNLTQVFTQRINGASKYPEKPVKISTVESEAPNDLSILEDRARGLHSLIMYENFGLYMISSAELVKWSAPSLALSEQLRLEWSTRGEELNEERERDITLSHPGFWCVYGKPGSFSKQKI